MLVNIKRIKKKQLIEILSNIGLALLVTSFYTIPLLESRISADYEVFKSSHMVRENVLIGCKVSPLELIFIKKDRMAYFLGIPVIVGLLLTIKMVIDYIKVKQSNEKKNDINLNNNKVSYMFFFITGIICVILTMDFIPFEKFPKFMTMMQFSFRLLEFSSFFLTVIASLNLGLSLKKFNMAVMAIILLVTADLLIPIVKNIDFSDRYINEDNLIQGVPVTERTGRVHAGCASFEYLPSKAFENRNYIENRENIPIVLDGNAKISDYEKHGTKCYFKVKGYGKIELPYIYYIGYTAKLGETKLKVEESENGFLQIEITKELLDKYVNQAVSNDIHKDNESMYNEYYPVVDITVCYEGTTTMKISLICSVVGIAIFIICWKKC